MTGLLAATAAWADAPSLAQQAWYFHPLSVVVVGWIAALIIAFPRERGALGSWALAATARAAVFEPRIFMHEDKSYATFSMARGNESPHGLYGDGYAAIMGTFWPLVGGPGDHVHVFDAVISSLIAPMAWLAAWHLTRDRAAALGAGVFSALLPWSVWMSPTETPYVAIATLQVAAVAGATGQGRANLALAALSAGLLAHVRPTEVVVAGLISLALLWRRELLAAFVAGALSLWRAAELVAGISNGTASTQAAHTEAFGVWRQPWTWAGHDGRIALLDPHLTPAALVVLAGFALSAPRRKHLWLPVVVVVADVVLNAHQPPGNDLLRFQLAPEGLLAVLAGVGAVALRDRWESTWARAVAVSLAVLSFAWAATPLHPWPVWVKQHRFLVAHLHAVPEGRTVRYSDAGDPNDLFYQWINRRSDAFWKPLDGDARPGEVRFVGWGDLAPGAAPVPWDRLAPIAEIDAAPVWSGLMNLSDQPVRIGLYRVLPPGS